MEDFMSLMGWTEWDERDMLRIGHASWWDRYEEDIFFFAAMIVMNEFVPWLLWRLGVW
jgi:hypothetical protein